VKVILTIDVEAHRVVDEISGDREDGLGEILAVLGEHGIAATFFVDVCEVHTWGHPFIRTVMRRIMDAGHDLQLHVHPHHQSKDNSKWHLSQYSAQEQEDILRSAVDTFTELAGHRPSAFRAGGFGANDDTLRILEKCGLQIDSSYLLDWPGCYIAPENCALPSEIGRLKEIPMTPVITVGTRNSRFRTGPLDFNWLPGFVIGRALRWLRMEGAPNAVLLMHSSSLYRRAGARRFHYQPRNREKLVRLLQFLQREGFEVETIAGFAKAYDFRQENRLDLVYTEKNPVAQYLTLLFQGYQGAAFKPKLAIFLAGNVIVWLLAMVCAYRMWF
jgi:peptidoglycan/xylan/chitin deacetylase (PgdA/CDA1 family)